MQAVSVNIGKPTTLDGGTRSGIIKRPVEIPLQVTETGLTGDSVCNTKHHGGPDQAMYLYSLQDYAFWEAELGHSLAPGTFGENVTIDELPSGAVAVGDRLLFPECHLEITAPRIPCANFGKRMADKQFPARFRMAERPGFYCRVLRPGRLRQGDEFTHTSGDSGVSIVDCFRFYYEQKPSQQDIDRMLAAPIAIRERERLRSRLDKPSRA